MEKKLMCKDVSGIDCSFEATGATNEEAKAALMAHAAEAHAEAMAAMSDEDKAAMSAKADELLAAQM